MEDYTKLRSKNIKLGKITVVFRRGVLKSSIQL